MKVNILYYLNIMTLMTCYSSQADSHYDFWKGKNIVYIDASPVYEPNTGNDYQKKIVKKEKIVIADNIVESIYDQLKARNSTEKEAHYTHMLTSKNARLEHEKELIEQTQMADYHEFNEMLSEWSIADGKRNGPVEKAIWEDQEKPKKLLKYLTLGTVGIVGTVAGLNHLLNNPGLPVSAPVVVAVAATVGSVISENLKSVHFSNPGSTPSWGAPMISQPIEVIENAWNLYLNTRGY